MNSYQVYEPSRDEEVVYIDEEDFFHGPLPFTPNMDRQAKHMLATEKSEEFETLAVKVCSNRCSVVNSNFVHKWVKQECFESWLQWQRCEAKYLDKFSLLPGWDCIKLEKQWRECVQEKLVSITF
jgi:hypothetical protein